MTLLSRSLMINPIYFILYYWSTNFLVDQLTIVIGVVEYIPQLLQLIEEVEEYIPQLLHNLAKVLEYIPELLLKIKYHCRCLDHRSKHLHL